MSSKKRVVSSVPGRCVLQGRLAFPALANPRDYQGDKRYRYQATVIFEKDSEAYKRAVKAIQEAAKAKWGEKAAAQIKRLSRLEKIALINGDNKSNYEGFEGNWAVQAAVKESTPPAMKNPLARDVPREQAEAVFYPGCVVNLHVEFYAQDSQFGERINASLRGIQFVADGDSFGGATIASADEFEAIEGAEDIDDFDDGEDDDATFDAEDEDGEDDFDLDDEEEDEPKKPTRSKTSKTSRKKEAVEDADFDEDDLF